MTTTANGYILDDPINGCIDIGTEVRPVMDDGYICPVVYLSAKVEGSFRTYVSTQPYTYLKVAYYEFPVPIQGYRGFLAMWQSVL